MRSQSWESKQSNAAGVHRPEHQRGLRRHKEEPLKDSAENLSAHVYVETIQARQECTKRPQEKNFDADTGIRIVPIPTIKEENLLIHWEERSCFASPVGQT